MKQSECRRVHEARGVGCARRAIEKLQTVRQLEVRRAVRRTGHERGDLDRATLELIVAQGLRRLGSLVKDGPYAEYRCHEKHRGEAQRELRLQRTQPKPHAGFSAKR